MRIRHLTMLLLLSTTLAGCELPAAKTDVAAAPTDAQVADALMDTPSEAADLSTLPVKDYIAAHFASSEHDSLEAAKYYRAALESDPKNQDLVDAVFFSYSSGGDLDNAARYAAKIVADDPSNRTARLVLAFVALKHHDFAGARKHLALMQAGSFISPLFDAWTAAGTRDRKTIDADLAALGSQGGAQDVAVFNRALILDLIGQTGSQTEDAYQLALSQNPGNPRLVDAYGRYLERQGRAKDAEALYAKYAGNDGIAATVKVARARMASGKKPDRLVASAEAGAAEALASMAASLSSPDLADTAIFYLRASLYLRPDLDLAAVLLGSRYEVLKKYDDANAAYAQIKPDSPYYRMASIEMALNEARLDRPDQAIVKLKVLADASPTDIEIWTSLGDAYRSGEKYGDAASAYDHAIGQITKPDQQIWSLYYSRAIAREQNKDWPGAEADLKKALEISPNEPQVLNYLGYSWIEKGQNLPDALAMLEKAKSLRPYDGYIVDSVGWAYYRLGRYDEAAQTLQTAVQLVPGDPTVNDHLGDALWRIGRKLDARFQWNHALSFNPEPEEKAGIEKKLQSGLTADDRRG